MLGINQKADIKPVGEKFEREPSPEALAFLDHVASLLAEEFIKIMKQEGDKK